MVQKKKHICEYCKDTLVICVQCDQWQRTFEALDICGYLPSPKKNIKDLMELANAVKKYTVNGEAELDIETAMLEFQSMAKRATVSFLTEFERAIDIARDRGYARGRRHGMRMARERRRRR